MDRSTSSILSDSWAVYCRHWGPLTGAYLVLFLVAQTGVALFFMGPFYVGICAMALAAVRGREVKFDHLFDAFNNLMPSFLAGLIYTMAMLVPATIIFSTGLAIGFGLLAANALDFWPLWALGTFTPVLAMLPVCAVVLLYTPAFFLLADGETAWEATLKNSAKLVRAEWTAWTGLWVVLGLAHLASVLLCVIPSFFISPWMVVALAMRYDRQRGEAMPAPAAARSTPPAPPPIPGAH